MNAPVFTPGPWSWHQCFDPTGKHVDSLDITFPGGHSLSGVAVIASVWSANEANASLIAVAPEMYSICEALDDFICDGLAGDQPMMDFCQNWPEAGDLLLSVRAVLTKVRGEPS